MKIYWERDDRPSIPVQNHNLHIAREPISLELPKTVMDKDSENKSREVEALSQESENEFELFSEEGEIKGDELDNVDPRCISQSINVLLGKSKGCRGHRSKRQVREDRASKKGIVSVLDFLKMSKGGYWNNGGLGILWNPSSISIYSIASNSNWMVVRVSSMGGLADFPPINVYGPIKTKEKARVWGEILNHVKRFNLDRVIVAGDFNAIRTLDDKLGGIKKSSKVMEDFRELEQ
ncbi:hypothetical protein SUGI_0930190 [Cryptomeria japonica]|nr:hypothetical protein SUGI_0930190 [Cryptomeria japonica]